MSESVSILPIGNSVNGIFNYLKLNDGKYLSRYRVETNVELGNETCLYSFQTSGINDYVATITGNGDITFHFDFPFYLTDYSFVNAAGEVAHSYPTGWNVYGKYKDSITYMMSSIRYAKFCEGSTCTGASTIKTYHIKRPKRINEIIISNNKRRLVVRSFEFFGVFCLTESNCDFKAKHSCIIKRKTGFSHLLF